MGGGGALGTRDEDYRFVLCKVTLEGIEPMVRFLTLRKALEARDRPYNPPPQHRLTGIYYYFVMDREEPHRGELTWDDVPAKPQANRAVSHYKPSRARSRASEGMGA